VTNEGWIAYGNEHLKYEAWMFLQCLTLLHSARPQTIEMNVLIQSCVIHLRNLIDFFYVDGSGDDVTAVDFAPGWLAVRPQLSAELQRAKVRANKELAHLTLKRIAGSAPGKKWDFDVLRAELRPVIKAFIASIDPSRFPQDAVNQLDQF